MPQQQLFDEATDLPQGLRYAQDFLTRKEEAALLDIISALPLQQAQYRQFNARRRIVSFGGTYDFSSHELLAAPEIPDWLMPLRDRSVAWAGLTRAADIDHALVTEYAPGTPLGWHRDVPDFDVIIGVSLRGAARMRFRRYPPAKPGRTEFSLDLEPRSIYTMHGAARWQWQHSVSPTKELRYSITFRTRRVP